MVLVHRVMTMEREAAPHVPEPDEDLDVLVAELHDVLAREVEVAGTDRHAVAAEDAELLEVDVDRARPSARLVPDDPPLGLIHLRGEAKAGAVHELPVDLPAAVAALEPERPRDARCEVGDLGQRDRPEHAVAGPGRDAGADTGSGSKLPSSMTPPTRRNSSSASPWPAARIRPVGRRPSTCS